MKLRVEVGKAAIMTNVYAGDEKLTNITALSIDLDPNKNDGVAIVHLAFMVDEKLVVENLDASPDDLENIEKKLVWLENFINTTRVELDLIRK
jgi:hypothetical protein